MVRVRVGGCERVGLWGRGARTLGARGRRPRQLSPTPAHRTIGFMPPPLESRRPRCRWSPLRGLRGRLPPPRIAGQQRRRAAPAPALLGTSLSPALAARLSPALESEAAPRESKRVKARRGCRRAGSQRQRPAAAAQVGGASVAPPPMALLLSPPIVDDLNSYNISRALV